MSPLAYLIAVLASGLGATVRYALTTLRGRWTYPWPTMAANGLGSFTLGAIAHAAVTATDPDTLMLIAGAGFAGGLSTFSTLAVDAVVLWREDRRAVSAGYLASTFALGLISAALGWALIAAL
jgi:CrcB protein